MIAMPHYLILLVCSSVSLANASVNPLRILDGSGSPTQVCHFLGQSQYRWIFASTGNLSMTTMDQDKLYRLSPKPPHEVSL